MTSFEIAMKYKNFNINPLINKIDIKIDDNIYKDYCLVFDQVYDSYIDRVNYLHNEDAKTYINNTISWFNNYLKKDKKIPFIFKDNIFSLVDIKLSIYNDRLLIEIIL